jgi:hypothetical protein
MRIIGGQFRGKRLVGPGAAGGGEAHLRPTPDRARESLFNLLAHGDYGDPPPPEGRRVLDLFAGTGALGLEALSRGAARVLFIDDLATARALIRDNVDALGVIGQTKIWPRLGTAAGSPPARSSSWNTAPRTKFQPPTGSRSPTSAATAKPRSQSFWLAFSGWISSHILADPRHVHQGCQQQHLPPRPERHRGRHS